MPRAQFDESVLLCKRSVQFVITLQMALVNNLDGILLASGRVNRMHDLWKKISTIENYGECIFLFSEESNNNREK